MASVILFGGAAALACMLGGLVFVLKRSWPAVAQDILIALGAGFILALVFLKLIPESLSKLGETAAVFILLGFAVIHFFEHTLSGHFHFGEETHTAVMASRAASLSALVGLTVHAFFDGFSISIGLQFDYFLGILIFCAIILHKVPEGLTIGSIMVAAGYSRRSAFLAAVGVGIVTLVGAVSVLAFTSAEPEVVGGAFAFSAGMASYVGASDLIPEINKKDNRILPVVVLLGMGLFYLSEKLLSVALGD